MQKWDVGFLIASGCITYLQYTEFLADTCASSVGLVLIMTLAAASAGSQSIFQASLILPLELKQPNTVLQARKGLRFPYPN